MNGENDFCRRTAYQVFTGIRLVYHDIHTQSAEPYTTEADNVLEINHCREGRMECNAQNEFCYISPGDIMLVHTKRKPQKLCFPLNHYHGVSVLIDLDHAPGCLSRLLDDVTVQPQALAEKFCGENRCFVARSNASFEHIFSELYSVPEKIKKGYFKIKVLELLLFLSAMDVSQDEFDNRMLSKAKVTLAKAVNAYLMEHMDEKISLQQISERFHISGTNIKNTYKAVYGVSLYCYIRTQKMESAAYMLEHTDKTIIEIAGEHGYDNASKFARAFRDVKGMSPTEYRSFVGK